jgi:hypothetical protein
LTEAKADSDSDSSPSGWGITCPLQVLGATLGVAFTILIAIYTTTDPDLSGPRAFISIVLGLVAIVVLTESAHRGRSGGRWRALGGAGLVLGAISLLFGVLPALSGAQNEDGGFRLDLKPLAPEFFEVALRDPIPLPSADEGWDELRRRGAIDVGESRFQMILANEGPVPVSILDIRAEVLGSGPLPDGTLAWHPAQGEEGRGQLVTLLPNGQMGSVGAVYDASNPTFDPARPGSQAPYFQTDYITLVPGEVYPVTLTVEADTQRTVRYRLTAEGETATREFSVKSPTYEIAGRFKDLGQRLFARYYSLGYFPNECTPTPENPWVDARNSAPSKACPHGLGRTYPVPLPHPSRFPPGQLNLRLGLSPAQQSATVSGVTVGRAPAASPVPGVVGRLLRALGAWDRCAVNQPEAGYWSAGWDRWILNLTFASRRSGDCTPTSPSPLRQIEVAEDGVRIRTNLGIVEVGSPISRLPRSFRRAAEAGGSDATGRYLLVPGVLPCAPTRADPGRRQIGFSPPPGGILAIDEDLPTTQLTGPATTLPAADC